MIEFQHLFDSMQYVANGLFFWQAMAIVTILAMMIGSMIYNGDVVMVRKAGIVLLLYTGIFILTTLARIYDYTGLFFNDPRKAYAGTVTSLFVTFFYLFGLFLGVKAHQWGRR